MLVKKDDIPWGAINRAGSYFQNNVLQYKSEKFIDRLATSAEYSSWMRNNWGIHHEPLEFKVIDEQKYTMFLLRWS